MDYHRSIAQKDRQSAAEVPPGVSVTDGSAWDRLPVYQPNWRKLRRNRIVAGQPHDAASAAFDLLRSKVLRQMRKNGWSTLAVTSPTSGCGKSAVALNLACNIARTTESRTVILDLDRRRPALARVLGIDRPLPYDRFLEGECGADEAFLRWGDRLALGVADAKATNSARIEDQAVARAIAQVREALVPDIILFDLPPVFGSSDVHSVTPNVDCLLIVAAAGASKIAELDACERELAEQTNILGIVLNKCRFMPLGGGY